MAYVFPSSQIGRMNVITDPTGTPAQVEFQMGGWAGPIIQNCLLSGVTASSKGNYQFLMTLRNFVYVYVFGERMGDFTVTGLAIAQCGDPIHGLTNAMSWYNNVAISVTGVPMTILMATMSFSAFLTGVTYALVNPKDNIAKFQYNFKSLPA